MLDYRRLGFTALVAIAAAAGIVWMSPPGALFGQDKPKAPEGRGQAEPGGCRWVKLAGGEAEKGTPLGHGLTRIDVKFEATCDLELGEVMAGMRVNKVDYHRKEVDPGFSVGPKTPSIPAPVSEEILCCKGG